MGKFQNWLRTPSLSGVTIGRATFKSGISESAVTSAGGNLTPDLDAGSLFVHSLNNNCYVAAPTNGSIGQKFEIFFNQTSNSGFTGQFDPKYVFPLDITPQFATGAAGGYAKVVGTKVATTGFYCEIVNFAL